MYTLLSIQTLAMFACILCFVFLLLTHRRFLSVAFYPISTFENNTIIQEQLRHKNVQRSEEFKWIFCVHTHRQRELHLYSVLTLYFRLINYSALLIKRHRAKTRLKCTYATHCISSMRPNSNFRFTLNPLQSVMYE